ncbi:ABC transporter permease [Actinoallomurus iriomotensis]|jgi:ABC-2 type transport system permease protein|uniref:Membrane protein n=1 Tax=Actinoallomurus iriomotensis TaxID=478107 RepID=A0A9W6RJ34_9ACTN|nr:ABC transporter permease [Actinoallomurus iriomotensis]GLY76653.1 membrane protein [Actinoallomurus iriomotensis]GLY91193.1 membrane protein [Actinoallomurus iriomotensis]
MTSVIHDIGYRHYDGPRLGRAYAVRSLFTHNLRAAYGLGRPVKAKIMPFLLFTIMLLPAAISVAITALASSIGSGQSINLIRYSAYAVYLQPLIAIFLAAQSPVLASRDLRFHVTPLYFSRPLSRLDYVLAKYGALTAALFILLGTPITILFIGALATKQKHLGTHALDWAGGLVGCLMFALVLAAIGLVVAAFTPRRGFGVTAVMAVYLISTAAVTSIQGIAESQTKFGVARWAGVFTPFNLVDDVQVWALGAKSSSPEPPPSGLGGPVFTLVCVAVVAGSLAILYQRFRKAGAR